MGDVLKFSTPWFLSSTTDGKLLVGILFLSLANLAEY